MRPKRPLQCRTRRGMMRRPPHFRSRRTASARPIPRCGHCCVVLGCPDLRQTVGPFAPLRAQHGLRSIPRPLTPVKRYRPWLATGTPARAVHCCCPLCERARRERTSGCGMALLLLLVARPRRHQGRAATGTRLHQSSQAASCSSLGTKVPKSSDSVPNRAEGRCQCCVCGLSRIAVTPG